MLSLRKVLLTNVIMFSVVLLLHLSRIVFQIDVNIGSWNVQYWINGIAVILLGTMIFLNGKHLKN